MSWLRERCSSEGSEEVFGCFALVLCCEGHVVVGLAGLNWGSSTEYPAGSSVLV